MQILKCLAHAQFSINTDNSDIFEFILGHINIMRTRRTFVCKGLFCFKKILYYNPCYGTKWKVLSNVNLSRFVWSWSQWWKNTKNATKYVADAKMSGSDSDDKDGGRVGRVGRGECSPWHEMEQGHHEQQQISDETTADKDKCSSNGWQSGEV